MFVAAIDVMSIIRPSAACISTFGLREDGVFVMDTKYADRFWKQVRKTDSCWIWTGARLKSYGKAYCGAGRSNYAHRAAWMLTRGAIPEGLCVLHRCDNPPCVNPDHLFLGSQLDNMRDMKIKGRSLRGRSPQAKLNRGDVHLLRRLWATGAFTCKQLGQEFNISKSSAHRIAVGLTY